MAYYERDYFREPSPRRSHTMQAPKLGQVSKILLFVVVITNVLVWGFEGWGDEITRHVGNSVLLQWLALGPSTLFPASDGALFAPWQLLTAGFLEPHLLGLVSACVFIIWLLGSRIEDLVGSRRYLVFFLMAIVAGNLVSSLVDPFIFEAIAHGEPITVYRLGMAPVACAVIAASALLFSEERTFLDLPFRHVLYVLLAIYLAMTAFGFFQPVANADAAIPSLSASLVGFFWGRLFVKAVIARGALVPQMAKRRVAHEPEEDYLTYAKKFSIDEMDLEDDIDDFGISRQEEKRLQREAEEQERVDFLLSRISAAGIDSLSRPERAFLERYSKRKREMSKK